MNIFPVLKDSEGKPEGKRAILIGKTGTGKTFAGMTIAKSYEGEYQIQVLATKEDKSILTMRDMYQRPVPIVTTIDDVDKYKFPEYPIVVYYPNGHELAEPSIIDGWCEWIYMRKSTVAVIDELTKTVKSTYAPPGFLDLYTRGRSQAVTVIAHTQRPRGVPPIVYDEAEYFYKFFLSDIKDRKRVTEFTHPLMVKQVSDKHGFHFYAPGESDNVYYLKSII